MGFAPKLIVPKRFSSIFFTMGQLLPTHRLLHSEHGGPFQPTIVQAIRLLSNPWFREDQPNNAEMSNFANKPDYSLSSPDMSDPFSTPHLTYSTDGTDTFPAPSAYMSRKYSWVHVFPEGFVHQHPRKTMRYFKWGVARLILEPDQCPDIVPMWIEGNEQVYHEARRWLRPIPRVGHKLGIYFGENVGGEKDSIFLELRRKWQALVERDKQKRNIPERQNELGILSEEMKYGKEATQLRKECALQVRHAILRLRHQRGLSDEDPKNSDASTWRKHGLTQEGPIADGSWVKDV